MILQNAEAPNVCDDIPIRFTPRQRNKPINQLLLISNSRIKIGYLCVFTQKRF